MPFLLAAATTLAAAVLVEAQSHNATTNNTTVDGRVGWVPSSGRRSTMNIIWSCISVLIVCTYKCVHLNISTFEQNRAGWHKTKRFGIPYWPEWLLIRKHLRKVSWMAIVLIAPEFGAVVAFNQLLDAREEVRKAQAEFPDVDLTLAHGFYAIAGGFAIDVREPKKSSATELKNQREDMSEIPGPLDTEKLSRSELLTGPRPHQDLRALDLLSYLGNSTDMSKTNNCLASLDVRLDIEKANSRLVVLCNQLPHANVIVTEEDIADRSKSDAFTKIFAIVQSTWLVLQSIARVCAGLPISELELVTMAYVFCAVVMYGLWWYKPFDTEHVTVVPYSDIVLSSSVPVKIWKPVSEIDFDSMFDIIFVDFLDTTSGRIARQAMLYGIATAFSAIHLVAWNWNFPTPISRILWRAFATVATAAGPVSISLTFSMMYIIITNMWFNDAVNRSFVIIVAINIFLYFVSRVALIVLVIYSFTSLPVGVYETVDWTTYFPYLS